MDIRSQVVSPYMAQQLRYVGIYAYVSSDEMSEYYWVLDGRWKLLTSIELAQQGGLVTNENVAPAYTVAELGLLLPGEFLIADEDGEESIANLCILKIGNRWDAAYLIDGEALLDENSLKEANARGLLLFSLLMLGFTKENRPCIAD